MRNVEGRGHEGAVQEVAYDGVWGSVPVSRSRSSTAMQASTAIPARDQISAVEAVPAAPSLSMRRLAELEGELVIDLRSEPPTLVVAGVDHLPLSTEAPRWSGRFAVRIVDLTIAVPAFIVSVPIVLILLVAVRFDSPGPSLFASRRITRDGRFFDMWKLRTMSIDGDRILDDHFQRHPQDRDAFAAVMKLENDPRVTRLGRVLRRWSLDELPQLFNVIRGDMSIIGPRPLLAEEAERMGPAFPTVVRVKGGLTGLWQVSGRSTLTFEQRVPLDVEYATSRTFRRDVGILLKTVAQLLRGRPGAY